MVGSSRVWWWSTNGQVMECPGEVVSLSQTIQCGWGEKVQHQVVVKQEQPELIDVAIDQLQSYGITVSTVILFYKKKYIVKSLFIQHFC